jgi:hypothetical protein
MKRPAGSSTIVVPTKLCGIASQNSSILWWFSDLDSILLCWLCNVLNQLVTVGDGLVQILLNPGLLSPAPEIRFTDSILHVNEVEENCRISHQIQKLSHFSWLMSYQDMWLQVLNISGSKVLAAPCGRTKAFILGNRLPHALHLQHSANTHGNICRNASLYLPFSKSAIVSAWKSW